MAFKFNSTENTPPGGFRYRVSQTGYLTRKHPTMDGLRRELAAHCHANIIPMPNDEMIEDYICKQLGPGAQEWCVDRDTGQPQEAYMQGGAPCRMSFSQVVNGTRTIGTWLLRGRQRVEHVEAERRARICATCSQNQEIHGCTGCSMPSLREAIGNVVGGGSTTVDGQLKGCCRCGCALKALVWMPLTILHERMPESENELLPSHCWKRKAQAAA